MTYMQAYTDLLHLALGIPVWIHSFLHRYSGCHFFSEGNRGTQEVQLAY